MNTRTPRARRLGSPIQLAVLTLLAGINGAYAQTAGVNATPEAPKEQQQAQKAAEANSTVIPEVYVTATKRSTSLQRTPVAVTAISAATLDDNHVQTIQDVVNLVPGFSATSQGDHGVITMTMRGIGNDSAKTEYADPEVAVFVDGIYSPRPEGATTLLFDLDGIEVLRGPQGTLWGRNSTVGAVNMQTAKPTLGSTSGYIEAGMGDYARVGGRGAFNIPLSDTAAMRVAFVHEQHDGYVDYQTPPNVPLDQQRAAAAAVIAAANAKYPNNPIAFQPLSNAQFVQGGPKYNAQDQTALRLSLLWEIMPNLHWNVSYERYQDRGTPSMNLMQTPRAGQDLWSALIDTAPSLKRDSNSVRSRVDWAINPDMSLAYIAGWSSFRGSSTYDQDGGSYIPTSFTTGGKSQANNTLLSKYKSYSHEVELQSTGKKQVDWLLGLYYGHENNAMRFDIPIMNGTQQGTVNWQGSFIQPKETVESKAVFGQATWNINDQLHLTGGARYTDDKRENIGGIGWGWNDKADVPQLPISPSTNPATAGSGFALSSNNSGSFSGSKATWLGRISYDITPTSMLYASVSTGYKSGGLQDGGVPYGQETLTNYEVGSKSTFMNGKVRMNNALYYEKFKGFQFSAPVTNPDGSHSLSTYNAEGAKVYGFETEIAAKITPADRVQFTGTYTHAELGQLIGGSNDYTLPVCSIPGISNCLDVTGNTMPHSPKWSTQIMYQHVFQLPTGTLTPRLSAHWESASWLSVFNLGEPDRQSSYAKVDLGLRYDADKKYYVDLFVRNAGDKNIKTSAQNPQGVWQAQYLPPRTIGFNAGYTF
ncbi:iron complex outermembrane receptor protein [Pseudoduganella flava]|uniref:Iron complex outermembrane receptor protein n=1 Tax=Pseudoduganella flava TaxID=871742 RepID=A0A562PT83_9BURK|nr:TonB-dependent receptor [Pseudoduganella flava]QGZ39389.1 TonB-dependent receptor plug domain-containing protein [Pseudoduganella flava]TWI47296.1 iron complex outermembrane receptor protein [Pseudoduganella flava]